jgi:hypothetical protein
LIDGLVRLFKLEKGGIHFAHLASRPALRFFATIFLYGTGATHTA